MKLNYFKCVIKTGENNEYLFPRLRICRIDSGEFIWEIGGKQFFFKKGDIVLLNNLFPRRIINKKLEEICIDIFEFLPIDIQNRPSLVRLFYCDEPTIIYSESGELISYLLNTICKAYSVVNNNAFFDHMIHAVFDLIESCNDSYKSKEIYSELSFKVAEYIWEHFSENISVPSIAVNFCISKSHLEKIFKKVHGISVGEYIRAIRVYNVISQLETRPDCTVLEIALSCGFNSSSGFYKSYKTVTGANPRRKQLF